MTRVHRSERGLSLVETLAALLIFSIITLGVVPLLMTSVTGAAISRSTTIAKTAVQKAMERARGLPYFLANTSQNTQVDLLDLYFPALASVGAGTSYSSGTYTTTCPGAATPRACPSGVPSGVTLTFAAEFVSPGPLVGGNETYVISTPSPGYAWNAAANADSPPTQLLRLKVTAGWSVAGRSRSLSITGLIGSRALGRDKLRGSARIDHVVEVLTSFRDVSSLTSDLFVKAGVADARIETRILSAADVNVRTAEMRLVQNAVDPVPASEIDGYSPPDAPSNVLRAPPDVNPGTAVADGVDTDNVVTHLTDPTIGNVAFLDTSRTKLPLRAVVASQTPIAEGTFEVDSVGVNPAELDIGFWVDTQALTGGASPLRLDAVKPVFYLQRKATGNISITGSVSSVTGNVVSDKRVESTASATFGRAHLFPVDYIQGGGFPVVRVSDFTATTRCKTTGTTAGVASATWGAGLEYWKESAINDGATAGTYIPVSLGTAVASDPLDLLFKPSSRLAGDVTGVNQASNPMVYEVPGDSTATGHAGDVYLFPVEHDHRAVPTGPCTDALLCHSHSGYLDVWDSKHSGTVSSALGTGGKESKARIDGALSITTMPTNATQNASGLVMSFGRLSCESVDNR